MGLRWTWKQGWLLNMDDVLESHMDAASFLADGAVPVYNERPGEKLSPRKGVNPLSNLCLLEVFILQSKTDFLRPTSALFFM